MAVAGSMGWYSSLIVGMMSVGVGIMDGYARYMYCQEVLLGVWVVWC
jgi:hypothetical protein